MERKLFKFDAETVNSIQKLIQLSMVTGTDISDCLAGFQMIETKDKRYENPNNWVYLTPEPVYAERDLDGVIKKLEEQKTTALLYGIGKLLQAGASPASIKLEDVWAVCEDVQAGRISKEEVDKTISESKALVEDFMNGRNFKNT